MGDFVELKKLKAAAGAPRAMVDGLLEAAPSEKLERGYDWEHPLAVHEWLASRILECVADPCAICRLALVNKNFCAASVLDIVWQKLLPPPALLSSLLGHVHYQPPSKKDLFVHLCKSITYDEGLKKFWLDPATGGVCHMISARALCIAWGNDPRYWQWKSHPGSMFSEVAYLKYVCWFQVWTTFQNVFRPGRYTISFRLQLHSAYGWERAPIKLCVQNMTHAHAPRESQVLFNSSASFKLRPCLSSSTKVEVRELEVLLFDEEIEGLWVECDVGEFVVDDDNENCPIEVGFSMREVLWGKRGLFLDGAIIRPSYVVENIDDNEKKPLPL